MLKKIDIASLRYSFILIGIISFAFSCGSQRTFQTKSFPVRFANYVIIEIPDFKTSLGAVPSDAVWKIPNEIAEKLKKEDLFTGVSRSSVSIKNGVLILDGNLVDFPSSIWYQRIIRTGKVTAQVRFIDKSEDKVLSEATFEGTSRGGVFGGGTHFAYERLVDEIVDYIKRNYSP